jgi:hypothetical protein
MSRDKPCNGRDQTPEMKGLDAFQLEKYLWLNPNMGLYCGRYLLVFAALLGAECLTGRQHTKD